MAARMQLHGHQISSPSHGFNEHWWNLSFPVSNTFVFLFLPWNSHSSLYVLPTTASVSLSAACQKRWLTTLAPTEWVHMWDVSSLTWSTPNVNTYAVQWPTSRRQASPDDAPAWACVGSSGRSLSTHSGPVLLHPAALNAFICFTSPLPNYQRQTVLKPNQIWDQTGSLVGMQNTSVTLKAKHCDTEPSADINVNHGAPLSPRMSTFAHAIWSKRHLLTLLQAPGCRGSHGRKWPTADGLSIPWAPGASINHQKQELTFPAREDDVPSSLIFLMTFCVKSALHSKSGANDGDLPLKQSFTLLPIKRFVAPSLWKRFSCQMIVIHGIMQILQGNMRSSNTAHTLAINRRNWWGADGRWSCLHRTIFCHLWV